MEQEISDNIIFLGRFHPLILHLPIGFLVIAFILEVLSRSERFRQYRPAVGFILLLGSVTAVLAAVLGYMLAQGGGYNDELLSIHQWSGIILAIAAVTSFFLHRQIQHGHSILLDRIYMGFMGLMMLSIVVAGHFGGSLTHGSDYLTQYMPNTMRNIAGLPPKKEKGKKLITNLNEAVVFDDIIYPILDSKCISCHNESKSKGELMLHTREAILKGGENGEVLIAGDANRSELIKRIHLPEIDDDHMPPKGKRQLTDDEVKLLTWWIDEEASFDKTVAEIEVDDNLQAVLNTLVDPDANKSEVEIFLEAGVKPAAREKLAQLQTEGIMLKPLSAEMNWLQAKLSKKVNEDSVIEALTGLAEQITWLDLGYTHTGDHTAPFIAQFKNLTRLHLQNTELTDEGLQYLKNLPYLEYLNLHGTEITDEGILQLADLKNLRKLYLWQTQVTDEGAGQLQNMLPELEVNLGIGNTMLPSKNDAAVSKVSEDTTGEKLSVALTTSN